MKLAWAVAFSKSGTVGRLHFRQAVSEEMASIAILDLASNGEEASATARISLPLGGGMCWRMGTGPEEIQGLRTTTQNFIINDRFWHEADIPAYVGLCPLLGVKRTLCG